MNQKCEEWVPLGTSLALITKKYFGALGQLLKDLTIDRNYSVLLLLDHENRPVSQQFIADYFLIDKAQMVRIMDYLMAENLISKSLNTQNRREYLVTLTGRAIKTMPMIKKSIQQLSETMFQGLTNDNKVALFGILSKISENLDGQKRLAMSMNLKPVKIFKNLNPTI